MSNSSFTKKYKSSIGFFLLAILLVGIIWKINPVVNKSSKVDEQLAKFIPRYEKASRENWEILTSTPLLKKDITHANVVKLKKRLQLTGDLPNNLNSTNPIFDKNLEKAVMLFQKRHGINANGVVDKQTLAALNISPEKRLQQIRANINRWKDFEQKKKSTYLWINLPDYEARFVENNKVTLKEKVIIGKLGTQTPVLFSEITDVILNPDWVVPSSIAQKTLIPISTKNPSYLEKRNINVYCKKTLKEVSPAQLPSLDSSDYFFRQQPGPQNPLGKIKFKITNSQSIYLHDTSTKELFENKNRALSAGCVRIQNPLNVLSKLSKYDSTLKQQSASVPSIIRSGETIAIKLNNPVPVYITYLTAWVDGKGLLHFNNDIYKRDYT